MVTHDDDDDDNDESNHHHLVTTYLVRDNDSFSEIGTNDGVVKTEEKASGTKNSSSSSSEVVLIENVLSSEEASHYLQTFSKDFPWNVEVDNFGRQTRQTCYFGDDGAVFSYVGLRLQPRPWPISLEKLRRVVEDACGLLSSSSSSSSPSRHHVLTACLANHYPTGEGHIPWHYDEVRAHGQQKVVASLSLGGPRRFQLRRRRRGGHDPPEKVEAEITKEDDSNSGVSSEEEEDVVDILLPSGSVLLMRGDVQSHYEHCLPLSTKEGMAGSTMRTNKTMKEASEISGDGGSSNEDRNISLSSSPHRISLTFRSIVPGCEDRMFQTTAQDSCCT